jgi:thiamine-monophosphate kinase
MRRTTHRSANKTSGPGGEQELIERIRRAVGGVASRNLRTGIGDDAAVLQCAGAQRELVVSCDAFLEGVHFLAALHPAESVGYKCLARAGSDLAAMGAEPKFFLLSMALPMARSGPWLDQFLSGLRRAARELGMTLIGGDTSRWPQVAVNVTVLGEIEKGRAVSRGGAKPGDLIYVTGRLGAAQRGLEIIRRERAPRPTTQLNRDPWLRAHLYPHIPVALGRWLASRRMASAMMDLSDGLSTDLARLCAASGTGARVWAPQLPLVQLPRSSQQMELDLLQMALHGGEDYGLLFTVPKRHARKLAQAPEAPSITQIGEVTRRRKIVLVDNEGREEDLASEGWDPFRHG